MKRFTIKRFFESLVIASAVLLGACAADEGKDVFNIKGVWRLQQMMTPEGGVYEYQESDLTWLRIYDDSCYYSCQFAIAPNGMMIDPQNVDDYTYIYKGGGDVLYLQGNNTYPLAIVNDSTMVIQERGRKYTWRMCDDIDENRCEEILGVIKNDVAENTGLSHRYVFSKAEKNLQTTNHTLTIFLIVIVAVMMYVVNYAQKLNKNKKYVEQRLRQIEQERAAMPEPVRKAMSGVESDFHNSDFYISLRKRIARGERLKKADWDEIENRFKSVYPSFCNTLFSLYKMSQVEYQVCLLLKLKVTPSEIASVLCKDTSSISSIRSRLYQKVFGKKGGSKGWDEFIDSL